MLYIELDYYWLIKFFVSEGRTDEIINYYLGNNGRDNLTGYLCKSYDVLKRC